MIFAAFVIAIHIFGQLLQNLLLQKIYNNDFPKFIHIHTMYAILNSLPSAKNLHAYVHWR